MYIGRQYLTMLMSFWVLATSATADDYFLTEIVPILRSRCVNCHNEIDRKGALSLQHKTDVLDSGYVIAGNPAESGLLSAIRAEAGKRPAMPRDGEPLTADQVAAVERWISTGAEWPDGFVIEDAVVTDTNWWSLKPVIRPEVPTIQNNEVDWIRTPVDAFILQELQARNLSPAVEADRRTLIRRLYFDLIGLPPSPDEVRAFVSNQDPLAYEQLVDTLLQSPHYGERWARHWLDVVKYADTSGYDKDKLRPNAWPYRDYVINAFNTDKPYARFVQEQIAGDVLFPGTADGILGLGFIAAGPWDWIGHGEVPESKLDGKIARHTDRDEMVSNTLNTFCSVTIQCCQCHNHKFDPFTQQHYYNLQSIFAAVDRADRFYDADPEIMQRRTILLDQVRAANAALKQIDQDIRDAGGEELQELEQLIAELRKQPPVTKRPEFGYHSQIAATADIQKWVQLDLGHDVDISKIILRPCHDDFNGIGAGFGFPVRFVITSHQHPDTPLDAAQVLHDTRQANVQNPGLQRYEIPLQDVKARYIRITATRLATRSNDYIFALAEVQILDMDGANAALNAPVTALDSIEAPVRWARKNLTDGIWPNAADEEASARLVSATVRHQLMLEQLTTSERKQERQRLQQLINAANAELKTLPTGKMVYAAATDFEPQGTFLPTKGRMRSISLLHRGNMSQPLEPSVPGTIPILPPPQIADHSSTDIQHPEIHWDQNGRFVLSEEHTEADRRAALAVWLTRNDHPLTWRSIVNRIWQYHFGRGLADSPNDFGRMGQLPTHPELLDWLAAEFRDNGQSFRSLHRLMVLSSTYRQSSEHRPQHAGIDSDNRYLWRMNRRRLAAEEIRDAMLSVSGRLNRTMGGPGYYLFVLERPEHSPHYEYHKFDAADPASHRRSIYRFIVRSQPDPWMTTLDCADSSQSTPQRNETLTSLQALSLLNNDFSLTMADYFASDLQQQFSGLNVQIDQAYQRICGRDPTDSERVDLHDYATRHGLSNLCRILFNLSEFVYID